MNLLQVRKTIGIFCHCVPAANVSDFPRWLRGLAAGSPIQVATNLQPENMLPAQDEHTKYRKITLSEGMELEIWGVVTGTYKSFK